MRRLYDGDEEIKIFKSTKKYKPTKKHIRDKILGLERGMNYWVESLKRGYSRYGMYYIRRYCEEIMKLEKLLK